VTSDVRHAARTALWAGIAGPVLFIVVFLVEGVIREGYDPVRLQVSYLSLGEGGWVQVLSFLVSGALILVFAGALRGVLEGGPGAVTGTLGVALAGAGLVIAGVFSTMPAFGWPPGTPDGFPSDIPPTGYLHVLGALCFFGGMILAPAALARRFWRERSVGWTVYCLATAVVVFVFQGAASSDPSGHPLYPDAVGLFQRIAIVAGLAWIALLAARCLRSDTQESRPA